MTLLRRRIAEIAAQHGSVRAAARVLEMDHVYLWRLMVGQKRNPQPALLRKLGIRRVVTFERIAK